MADKTSIDQYGRKTWNLELYAQEAKRKSDRELPQDSVLASQNLKDGKYDQHRADLIESSVLAVKKHTLISSGGDRTATFGKNKRFGFFCPVCDLSFRDTLALVDHVNSPQHAKKARSLVPGDSDDAKADIGGVKHANAAQVAEKIEELVKKLLRAQVETKNLGSLHERILKRQKFEEKRRQKRKEKKLRKASDDVEFGGDGDNDQLQATMGFHGFGSTKV